MCKLKSSLVFPYLESEHEAMLWIRRLSKGSFHNDRLPANYVGYKILVTTSSLFQVYLIYSLICLLFSVISIMMFKYSLMTSRTNHCITLKIFQAKLTLSVKLELFY